MNNADAPQGDSPTPSKGTAVNRFLTHKPLTLGKKLHLMEFIAERSVQAVAFISIAAILGIFYYVFQEATWAFRSGEPAVATVTATTVDGTTEQPSSAGPGDGTEDGGMLTQETYGGDETPSATSGSEELKPESYGTEELTPEVYGAPPDAATGDLRPGAPESTEVAGSDRADVADAGTDAAPPAVITEEELPVSDVDGGGHERPVTVDMLLRANDTIDGAPRHIWQPVGEVPKYSFVPLLVGALKVTLIGLLLAAPIAILAALFTSAFAPRWAREILKPAIEILAGFPSVVIGFFCLMTLATVMQAITESEFRLNALVGGIGMAIAVIPIIYTVTEDALAAVPKSMKEASLAMGASRWQTAYRVTLPAAIPGVFAAVILGFGRAFGETMIALMATGNAALVSADIFESVRTMAATIGAEMAEVEFHSVHYGVLFLIGAVLFVVTFTMNALAEFWIRRRLLKRFQGQ